MALIVLQTIGADVFVNLSENVDVEVQSVVERCLRRMQQPGVCFILSECLSSPYQLGLDVDAKLARHDVETTEFIVDSQFSVHSIERVKQ